MSKIGGNTSLVWLVLFVLPNFLELGILVFWIAESRAFLQRSEFPGW